VKHRGEIPPLEAILAVIQARRSGSFTAAAVELGLTHGAISRRITAVEKWAGFRLFERHGRGVRPTLRGDACINELEHALDRLRSSRQPVPTFGALEVVHLNVAPSFARLWLMPNLELLEGTPPDLRIEIEADQRFAILSETRIAVRFGLGQWAGVTALPLFSENVYPVAAAQIGAAQDGEWAPEDILNHPILHDATDEHWREWFAHHNIDYARRPGDRVFSDYDLTLDAAARGLGIALLRMPYAAAVAKRSGLRIFAHQAMPLRQRFYLISKLGERRPAAQRVMDRIMLLSGKYGTKRAAIMI